MASREQADTKKVSSHHGSKVFPSTDKDSEDVRISVPHVEQQHSWDCGLACSRMILHHFKKSFNDFDELCTRLDFGTSVWTIDLCSIMNHYSIRNRLTTITMGVDKEYSKKNFYKDKFTSDEKRVNDLFENPDQHNIVAENKSVELIEIVDHLAAGNLVIALVDWNNLSCKWCASRRRVFQSMACVGRCFKMYQGHFIVICGFNKKDKVVYYKNPSYKQELCCCSWRTFEAARKSYGTDEDLLFVFSDATVSSSENDQQLTHTSISQSEAL